MVLVSAVTCGPPSGPTLGTRSANARRRDSAMLAATPSTLVLLVLVLLVEIASLRQGLGMRLGLGVGLGLVLGLSLIHI